MNNFKEVIITKTNSKEYPFHMTLQLEDQGKLIEEDFRYINECLGYVDSFSYGLDRDPEWKPTEGSWLK